MTIAHSAVYVMISILNPSSPSAMAVYPTRAACDRALPEMRRIAPTVCSELVVNTEVANLIRRDAALDARDAKRRRSAQR